ncbi:MAG: hypothetical protein ACJASM_000911 [Salibacteraceae bacterium]|jgi:hypothetical protein
MTTLFILLFVFAIIFYFVRNVVNKELPYDGLPNYSKDMFMKKQRHYQQKELFDNAFGLNRNYNRPDAKNYLRIKWDDYEKLRDLRESTLKVEIEEGYYLASSFEQKKQNKEALELNGITFFEYLNKHYAYCYNNE